MTTAYSINDKIEYTVFLIDDFAKRYNLTSKQAFNYLDMHGGISFIDRNYGIAHTQSFEDMVENLGLVCRNNGGSL